MLGTAEALGVDLIDVLCARRTRREPAAFGRYLDPADGRVVTRRLGNYGLDRLAGEFLGVDLVGAQVFQDGLLLRRRAGVDPLIERWAEVPRQTGIDLARIATSLGGDLGCEKAQDDTVLVGGPHRAVAAQERRTRAFLSGE